MHGVVFYLYEFIKLNFLKICNYFYIGVVLRLIIAISMFLITSLTYPVLKQLSYRLLLINAFIAHI